MDKFNKLLEYFKECLTAVNDQIDTSKLLDFFLNP